MYNAVSRNCQRLRAMTPAETLGPNAGGVVASVPGLPPAEAGSVDFFVSRRGAGAEVAQEITDVLQGAGHTVLVQDYDIPYSANFVIAMHEALKRCRHLIVLLTRDYDASAFTMAEVGNFLAAASRAEGRRRLIVIRIDDCEPEGLFAGIVFGDLAGIEDPEERKRRILSAAEGRSTGAPRKPKIFENVPPRDVNFTGRDSVIDGLRHRLTDPDEGSSFIALQGLGGIGKSALAAEYAHRHAGDFSGVWWAPAEDRTVLTASLAILGARLEPRLAGEQNQEKAARAALGALARGATPFLLIYDNATSPETLRDLIPTTGAFLLVTTRWSDWGGGSAEMRLDALAPEAATAFLQKRAGRTDAAGAAALADALGRLPLALDHAGAYCRLTATSFKAYRDKIDLRISRAPKGASYPSSVAATFGLAIEKAAAECSAAERLLGMLAYLAPEHVPITLIGDDLLNEDERAEALLALSAVSLVELSEGDDAGPSLSVHRLVQAAMRARSAEHGETERDALTAMVARVAGEFPTRAYEAIEHWPRCEKLLPHALTVVDHAKSAQLAIPELPALCIWVGEFLHGRGSLTPAADLFRDAARIGEAALGGDDPLIANAINNLANALSDAGEAHETEALYRKALDMQERTLGHEHRSTVRTLTNLALFLGGCGRADEAEALLREAIRIGESTIGRTHADIAARLNNLALVLRTQARDEEAEQLLREAIALGEKALGRTHPQVAVRLNNLGSLLQAHGRFDEAEALFRESIENGSKALGSHHPDVAGRMNNLALLFQATDRPSEAEALFREALATLEGSYGERHPNTARVRRNLARLLLAIAELDEAQTQAERAYAVHAETLGPDAAWTAESAATLAQVRSGIRTAGA